MLPAGDAELVQILDAALLDAAARSGHWLACRPGCNQCCTGVFRISALDAERLRHGLGELTQRDQTTASQLRSRLRATRERLASTFPGDALTGLLYENEEALEAFESFANEEVCPVLDPASGTCTLYAHRPVTCRTFGPPVETEDGSLGVCELCFVGASPEEVAAAKMALPPADLEDSITRNAGLHGSTIVAFALQLI